MTEQDTSRLFTFNNALERLIATHPGFSESNLDNRAFTRQLPKIAKLLKKEDSQKYLFDIMSRPTVGAAGIGSSMWSSPSTRTQQMSPLQLVQNVAPAARVPPHLRTTGQEAQTPESKPAGYIPPHLRGFNTPLKENATLNRPIPSQPQVNFIPAINVQQSEHPIQDIQFQKHGMFKNPQVNHNIPLVTQSPAVPVDESAMYPVQPISGAKRSPEDRFLAFMSQKTTRDVEAKKKAVTEKAPLAAVQAQPVQGQPLTAGAHQSLSELQPYILQPLRSKFRPTEQSDKEMQAFLINKVSGPVSNGKKYLFTGGQESPQTASAASKPAGDGSKLQVASSSRKENTSPFVKADPHSAFSPRDLTAKITSVNVDAPIEAGFEPRRSSEGFDDNISDTGIGENPKENVRATQGHDAKNELVDWDGRMMPPPVDWETDRGTFDNSFVPKYIREDWEPKVPRGPLAAVQTTAKEFQLAVPVGFDTPFMTPPQHPLTVADYANSENEQRQRLQTAAAVSTAAAKRLERRTKTSKGLAEESVAHNFAIMSKEPEPHPYAPTIDVYLRPATETDLKGIADIYNHYAQSPHSIVTEDQAAITEEDVAFLINHTKGEKLPIMVAVRGRMPLPSNKSQNHAPQNVKSPLPQFEGIIGFGYAETYCYGIGGGRAGRTRFTANIHFYVHPEYTGKKVGRSLLDRLIKSLSHGYGAKDGYDWMNPTDDPVYNPGGVQRWHQIIIQLAVQPKDDPNYVRMKNFLSRYFFEEEGRIRRIVRSSVEGHKSNFADIVFFSKEASSSMEFPSNI